MVNEFVEYWKANRLFRFMVYFDVVTLGFIIVTTALSK